MGSGMHPAHTLAGHLRHPCSSHPKGPPVCSIPGPRNVGCCQAPASPTVGELAPVLRQHPAPSQRAPGRPTPRLRSSTAASAQQAPGGGEAPLQPTAPLARWACWSDVPSAGVLLLLLPPWLPCRRPQGTQRRLSCTEPRPGGGGSEPPAEAGACTRGPFREREPRKSKPGRWR